MRKFRFSALLVMAFVPLVFVNPAFASKDGSGHDYRTFHTGGKIDMGNICD